MKTADFTEVEPAQPLSRRVREQWWVFFLPLYPLAWVWVVTFLLAFFINQPIQWNHLNANDNSYVIFQVQPFKTWPSKQPFGKFHGTALTRNLAGFLEAADLKEYWFVPLHVQIARRLDVQTTVPPSPFVRSVQVSD
jgi:hypothetical protein